jgi:hypothetical protein
MVRNMQRGREMEMGREIERLGDGDTVAEEVEIEK